MRFLSILANAVVGALGAVAGLFGLIFGAFARAAGIMPRQPPPMPPADMIERAKERSTRTDPMLESLKQLRRNAVSVIGWAADARNNTMAIVPAELPPDIGQWCIVLSSREQQILTNSSIQSVMNHMSGTAPIAGILQVGAAQRPEWKPAPPEAAFEHVMASPNAQVPAPGF